MGRPEDPGYGDAMESGQTAAAPYESGEVAEDSAGRPVLHAVRDLPRIPAKLCPTGHPNDPDGSHCRICERRFDAAAEIIEMPPAPLARLVFEDGSAVEVVGRLTVGRSPLSTSGGDTLTVTGRQVSRRHLTVEAAGWRLTVQDCDSTNGTFIARTGERGRRRVPPHEPVPLRLGDTLHFGSRQALVIDARSV